ncbi:hypothetical protein DL96DRAFT_157099 [Flagelloscypha sp. PMI_526]|nr:hypothetical protein DL96DRAFT_157099 [Flagelloscypha sp. PMI_526]
MSSTQSGDGKRAPVQITEDEAAVYDRQIRLWGIEAQQRMRNATILVIRLKGTATETIKNLVLAGIGKLIFVDEENVSEEDLGAGFFFRDEDVGKKRVEAAKARIESLNPLVAVESLSELPSLDNDTLVPLLERADLVCMTDWNRDDLIRVNQTCRRLSKPFYAGGTFGLFGYIFCDLLDHDFVTTEKNVPQPRNVKVTVSYPPLATVLQNKWSSFNKRETKRLKLELLFSIWGIWEYQSLHADALPNSTVAAPEVEKICNRLISDAAVNVQALPSLPSGTAELLAETAAHELSPVCAVVGGMLAQDILKALAAKEPPIANFFVFNGVLGGASVYQLAMAMP